MTPTELSSKYKVCHLERVEYEQEAKRRFMHSISLVETEFVDEVYYENFPADSVLEDKWKKAKGRKALKEDEEKTKRATKRKEAAKDMDEKRQMEEEQAAKLKAQSEPTSRVEDEKRDEQATGTVADCSKPKTS